MYPLSFIENTLQQHGSFSALLFQLKFFLRLHNEASAVKDVEPVVTGGVEAPEGVLEAESGVGEREILGRGVGGEPDAMESVGGGEKRIAGDVVVIVPDEAGVPGGLIGEDDGGDEESAEEENLGTRAGHGDDQ